jgi:iron complex outermembrane receptor protein
MFNPVYGTDEHPLYHGYYGEDVTLGINAGAVLSTDNSKVNFTSYVQDQISFGKFVGVLGLGLDSYEQISNDDAGNKHSNDAISSRAGVVYKAKENLSLYINYGEGFEQQSIGIQFDPDRYGGPFDDMTSSSTELGVKGIFLQNRLNVSAAVYDMTKYNILYRAPTDALPDRRVQIGEFVTQGLEFDVSGQVSDALSIYGSYAHSLKAEAVEGTYDDVTGLRTGDLVAPNHPTDSYNLWGRYNKEILGKRGLLGFTLGLNGMTERTTFYDDDNLPGYTVFDGGIYLDYMQIGISFIMNNLTDEKYFVGGYGNRVGAWRGKPRSFETRVTFTF